ncbi:MAG: ACP S-malonyltransferase [Chlamydiae bacterium]|nr:ACP S-malonyltransferase [Chlamydiota bacterium]MBI3278142.1 ACP S-malonyltransferase [Chlamydiota bacterium]
MKIALLFPGQGAQYVGMGKEFFSQYEVARELFLKANDILGFDLSRLCFEGPEEELTSTKVCQPAIFVTSLASLAVLKSVFPEIQIEAVAGLSLGEFTALTAAKSLKFEDALKIVSSRGKFMEEACLEKSGTMASILGLEYDQIKEICQSIVDEDVVTVANVNSPGQIVISGTARGIDRASHACKERGARRVISLQVSGAFHSPLMESAQAKLQEYLKGFSISQPQAHFFCNVLGEEISHIQEIRNLLIEQVTHSVLWEQSIRSMVKAGFDFFIEVGCGKVLSGLQRKIAPDTKMFNVEDVESLEKIKNAIEN